jgi:quercetin dioxygenase-like cupin family protein
MIKPLCLLLCLAGCASAPMSNVAQASRAPLVVPAGSEGLDLGEGAVRILAEGAATGGGWAMIERTEPPGTRTALHRHNRMDEAFYVVSGTFTVFVEGKLHRLGPGGFVFIPRGTPHAQGNSSAGTVKIVSFFSPAGWERSARERAGLHARHPAGTPEFAERIGEVFARHDIEVLGPSPIPAAGP